MRRASGSGPTCTVAVLVGIGAFACGGGVDDPRAAAVVNAMVASDINLIRTRPQLVPGKYARMTGDLYSFYRGSVPIYLADATRGEEIATTTFDAPGVLPLAVGDAHPENFGTLRATDGSFAIEPNDFDAADRYPYIWDLRRLTVGMVIAARVSNPGDPAAREVTAASASTIAHATALGYAETLRGLAAGGGPQRITEAGGSPHFDDLFERSFRDEEDRRELQQKTEVDGSGARRFTRGAWDPEDPQDTFSDLPAFALEAIPSALATYRASLLVPPPEPFFAVKDAVREHGSGVASWARLRILILVEGPTASVDDDVILELKEIVDAPVDGWAPPGVFYDDVGARVLETSRTLWARPDAEPLWGTTRFLGFDVQIKQETDAFKNLRTSRMEEERGTADSLIDLGGRLGGLVARMHAASEASFPGTLGALAAAIGDEPVAFADEQAAVSVRYADQVGEDFGHFQGALAELGPRLGVPFDEADTPSADLAALYGEPLPGNP